MIIYPDDIPASEINDAGYPIESDTPRLMAALQRAYSNAGVNTIRIERDYNLTYLLDAALNPRLIKAGQYHQYTGLLVYESRVRFDFATGAKFRVIDIPNTPSFDYYCAVLVARDLIQHPEWYVMGTNNKPLLEAIPWLEEVDFYNLTIDATPLTTEQVIRATGQLSGGFCVTRSRYGRMINTQVIDMPAFAGNGMHVGSERMFFDGLKVNCRKNGTQQIGSAAWFDGAQDSTIINVETDGGISGFVFAITNDYARLSSGNILKNVLVKNANSGVSITGDSNKVSDAVAYRCGQGLTLVAGEGTHVHNFTADNTGANAAAPAVGSGIGAELRFNGLHPVRNTYLTNFRTTRVWKGIIVRSGAYLNRFQDINLDVQYNHPATGAPGYGAYVVMEAPPEADNSFVRSTFNTQYVASGYQLP